MILAPTTNYYEHIPRNSLYCSRRHTCTHINKEIGGRILEMRAILQDRFSQIDFRRSGGFLYN